MNKNDFLDYVHHKCLSKNILFKTNNETTINTEMKATICSGFFEENSLIKPTLGIAGGLPLPTFFEVLAHEYCHSQQWSENSIYWKESRLTTDEESYYSKKLNKNTKGYEAGDILSCWLDKEIELTDTELEDLTRRTTAVEFDCENRTVNLIKELNLELDPVQYAQKANAYLLTYYFSQKERIWTTPGKATYSTPEIYTKMPTEINPDFCKQITPDMINLIKLYCL